MEAQQGTLEGSTGQFGRFRRSQAPAPEAADVIGECTPASGTHSSVAPQQIASSVKISDLLSSVQGKEQDPGSSRASRDNSTAPCEPQNRSGKAGKPSVALKAQPSANTTADAHSCSNSSQQQHSSGLGMKRSKSPLDVWREREKQMLDTSDRATTHATPSESNRLSTKRRTSTCASQQQHTKAHRETQQKCRTKSSAPVQQQQQLDSYKQQMPELPWRKQTHDIQHVPRPDQAMDDSPPQRTPHRKLMFASPQHHVSAPHKLEPTLA